jgi:hypothetical protein
MVKKYKVKSKSKKEPSYLEGLRMLNLQIRSAESDSEKEELYYLRRKWKKKHNKI